MEAGVRTSVCAADDDGDDDDDNFTVVTSQLRRVRNTLVRYVVPTVGSLTIEWRHCNFSLHLSLYPGTPGDLPPY